jgi:copper chaperone CopZ
MSEEKTCFVIAPIGEPESKIRERSDKILRHVITPVAQECGYKPIRADDISEPGIITTQVIQHIVDDELIIADLTGQNPNVFYELAIAHAFKKPLIQIIEKGEQIPFDIASTRTIYIDHTDLDDVDKAKKEISRQIKSVEGDTPQIDTPISVAIDLQTLKQSEDPEKHSMADLFTNIAELRSYLIRIEKAMNNSENSLHLAGNLILPNQLSYAVGKRIIDAQKGDETDEIIKKIETRIKDLNESEPLDKNEYEELQNLLKDLNYYRNRNSNGFRESP